MADILKDIYDKSKRQQKVIFQNSKPLLNYELNLLQDILKNKSEDFTKFSIGNNYSGDSLKVIKGPLANEIIVEDGTFYHNGFPIDFTVDKRLSVPVPPGVGSRDYIVYVEWYIDQVDTPADVYIGFETTEQNQLVTEIKIAEGTNPLPTNETIVFDSATKKITITNGFFPDWMRVENAEFVTDSTNNPGSSFFTVDSSPDNKNIIVNETLVDETLDNITFKEFHPSDSVPKKFKAYRRNILLLAKLTRDAGNNDVDIIQDLRDTVVYNYVVSGGKIEEVSGLDVSVSQGEVYVGDVNHFIESGTPNLTLADDDTNYVYVNSSGAVTSGTSEPTESHLMLSEVRTAAGSIVSIDDERKFTPIAWDNKYGGGDGSGETGFPSLTQEFTAGENISAYEAVYVSSDNTVSKASASDIDKLPVIGLAVQDMATGQKDNIITFGKIGNSSWSWTAGEDVFIDTTSGGLTDSTGVTSFITGRYVHRVGIALSPTQIFVKPDLTYIKKDNSAEANIVVQRDNGDLEVMGPTDKLDPDRLSFLAPIEIPTTKTFDILPGRYSINDNDDLFFAGVTVNLGAGGNFETTAIPANYYNRLFFTLNDSNVLNMYEGDASPTPPTEDPSIPANELPVCVVNVQDTGAGINGSVLNIAQTDINDKRSWLDLGSTDNHSLKAIYRDTTTFLVQKGEMWVNEDYISLPSTVIVSGGVSAGTHYVYLDMSSTAGSDLNITANAGSFTTSTTAPTALDRRTFIPLATYDASGTEILRATFKTYRSKFWQFRDKPFSDDQTFNIVAPKTVFDTTAPDSGDSFQFSSTDFLKITVNGIEVYETDDYTKNPATNEVTFLSSVFVGAKVKIRKV
jgi:hypothetical protein